jgi:GNAT superfamily N-acetyltransferase
MLDGSAIAAVELRFREDLWRTAPIDAVEEAEVRSRRFGPVLATVFGDLPDAGLINLVQGAAEPGAVRDGHLAAAIEWVRSREVDFRISVAADRPGTRAAEDWLLSRGYERGSEVRRFTRAVTTELPTPPPGVAIRELGPLETEGMSHIVAKAFELPGLATVLIFGLPERDGWRCYAASVDGREAACGSLMVVGDLGLLTLDATLPFARGRGCQRALIARRLVDAAAAGCDAVVTEVCDSEPVTPAATANLERTGFTEIPGRTNWRRPSGIA